MSAKATKPKPLPKSHSQPPAAGVEVSQAKAHRTAATAGSQPVAVCVDSGLSGTPAYRAVFRQGNGCSLNCSDRSNAWAARNNVVSSSQRPMSCTDWGSPSANRPAGRLTVGWPE